MADILLVDDNEELRALLAESLVEAGHQVFEAGDGRIANALLRERRFAAVVTDMLMPEVDGTEVLAVLRKLPERPILVVISGGGSIEAVRYLQMARALGADEVLQKPFLPSSLTALVGRLLAQPPTPQG